MTHDADITEVAMRHGVAIALAQTVRISGNRYLGLQLLQAFNMTVPEVRGFGLEGDDLAALQSAADFAHEAVAA